MPSPPDASLNELMDATLSWQSSDSDSMHDNSGDNSTAPSSYLSSHDTEDGPGDEDDISPTGSGEDHLFHYPHDIWQMNTTPPHNNPPADDGDDDNTWHDISPSSHHHRYSSLNDSSIFDEGSYVRFSDHHPSSAAIPRDPSAFTPINEDYSSPDRLRLY